MDGSLRFGSFCTSVLRTSDPQRAIEFYSSLIGWTAVPAAPAHTFLQFNGKTVASLQHVVHEHDAWVPYVLVENAHGVAAAAVELGAAPGDRIDVAGVATLMTLRDPEGARFGLWQPAPHRGAETTDQLGSIWWIEVLARDAAIARDFYTRLFAWSVRETSFEPLGLYRVFERPGNQEGGLLQIPPQWGELDPLWNTIISVDDCDGAMRRACKLGGGDGFVHTVPKHGRIGSIFDPGGAELILRGPVPGDS